VRGRRPDDRPARQRQLPAPPVLQLGRRRLCRPRYAGRPFIARNQGHRADVAGAFSAFGLVFPHNSPSYFCFAALQGIAQALGFRQIAAVKAGWQSAWTPADARHFANAYDGFWETLGGVPLAGRCWRIALPLQLKPLAEIPSRHRKRAALRREHWQAVGEMARLALQWHTQARCSKS
jgi:hypothetical protein